MGTSIGVWLVFAVLSTVMLLIGAIGVDDWGACNYWVPLTLFVRWLAGDKK